MLRFHTKATIFFEVNYFKFILKFNKGEQRKRGHQGSVQLLPHPSHRQVQQDRGRLCGGGKFEEDNSKVHCGRREQV